MEKTEREVLDNIEAIREKQKLTRKALAEMISISESAYSRLINGEIALSYERLAQFAKAFKIPTINIITYPEIFINQNKSNSTKVLIELDVNDDEFIKLGLKEKVLQILNK